MKCFFHPKEDALYDCTQCGKPICGKCMRFDEDDLVVCPACTLEKAVDVAVPGMQQFLEDRHKIHDGGHVVKRPWAERLDFLPKTQLIGIAVVLLVQIMLRYYIGETGKPTFFDVAEFRSHGDPAPETVYVIAKVFEYANDHAGKIPDNAGLLYPHYLESRATVLGSEDDYTCSPLEGPEQMVVGVHLCQKYGYRKLYAFGDGVLHIR